MQFHVDGFRVGDPDLAAPSAVGRARETSEEALPTHTDVLIIGAGSAGLTLAAQLAAFPEIAVCVVEQKDGPLKLGQADGIACRTVEMFNAFGFAEQVLREAYWVNETVFWRPAKGSTGGIVRGGWTLDTEPGLSEFPHVILNQARVHGFFLDIMRKSANRAVPYYGWKADRLEIADDASQDYPVTATMTRSDPAGKVETSIVHARYAVGCDGARSRVRQSLGLTLDGDSANQAWGVMDVLAVTDFPDIRKKALIRSPDGGSIVLIPREGGFLARFYVELDKLGTDERAAQRNITLDQLINAARRILRPYSFEVKDVAWWSVYEIGQRLCSRFDDVANEIGADHGPRIFIAGDACHTHSPKAGQGMNVSMQDAFNLGWKLAAVLQGQSSPEILRSYSAERQAVAQELIDFDRNWSAMLSAPLRDEHAPYPGSVTPEEIQAYFVKQGRYTAGTATRYAPSQLTGTGQHQNLAPGFQIGMRLHSAPVVRLADARPMHLGHTIKADGRWRMLAFAGRGGSSDASSSIWKLCEFLADDPASPLIRFTPENADPDAVIDFRAIYQESHHEIDLEQAHPVLLPPKGRLAVRDYEKLFCADRGGSNDIFDLRGVDRDHGCLIIVRPDQYVSEILPLDAHKALGDFFAAFMIDQHGACRSEPAIARSVEPVPLERIHVR